MKIDTLDVFNYIYIDDYGVNVRGEDHITFTVRANNDAHIALSQVKGEWKIESYEIVIGECIVEYVICIVCCVVMAIADQILQ